jgi:hypothetical protein
MKLFDGRHTLGITAALLLSFGTANADLTVQYRVTQSELVLFGQKQESPFGRVRYSIQIKGNHLRTEMTDHFGRTLWLLADRKSGEAFGIDPEARSWWRDAGVWTCDQIPAQVARGTAQLLASGGITDLDLGMPKAVTLAGARAHRVEVHFQGKILGAPQAVDATLVLYFADDEAASFGANAADDLYCGKKPPADEWEGAFTRYLRLSEAQAGALAGVVGLPLQIELTTDLGLGQASLTLVADDIDGAILADSTFRIPSDFQERK